MPDPNLDIPDLSLPQEHGLSDVESSSPHSEEYGSYLIRIEKFSETEGDLSHLLDGGERLFKELCGLKGIEISEFHELCLRLHSVVSQFEKSKLDFSSFEKKDKENLLRSANLLRVTEPPDDALVRLTLNADLSPDIARLALDILATKEGTTEVDRLRIGGGFSAEWRRVHDVLSDPNSDVDIVCRALLIGILSELPERHTRLFESLHPCWHTNAKVVETIHTTYRGMDRHRDGYFDNGFGKSEFPGLNRVTADALAKGEDPRKSEGLLELLVADTSDQEFFAAKQSALQNQEESTYSRLTTTLADPKISKPKFLSILSTLPVSVLEDNVSTLRELQGRFKRTSLYWVGATMCLAFTGDKAALEETRQISRRRPKAFRSVFLAQSYSHYLVNERTGEFAEIVLEHLKRRGPVLHQMQSVLSALHSKEIEGRQVLSDEGADRLLDGWLRNPRITGLQKSRALQLARALDIEIKGTTLAEQAQGSAGELLLQLEISNYIGTYPKPEYTSAVAWLKENELSKVRMHAEMVESILERKVPDSALNLKLTRQKTVFQSILDFDPMEFRRSLIYPLTQKFWPFQTPLNNYFKDADNRAKLIAAIRAVGGELSKEGQLAEGGLLQRYADALDSCEELGIESPFRLKPSALIDVVQRRLSPNQTYSGPFALVIGAKDDHNGALKSLGNLTEKLQAAGYQIVYYEIGRPEELVTAFAEFRQDYEDLADLIWISAHAEPWILDFSEIGREGELWWEDLETFLKLRVPFTIAPNGQIVIHGCATSRKISGSFCISERFETLVSDLPEVSVVSSERSLSYTDFQWSELEDGRMRVSLN